MTNERALPILRAMYGSYFMSLAMTASQRLALKAAIEAVEDVISMSETEVRR